MTGRGRGRDMREGVGGRGGGRTRGGGGRAGGGGRTGGGGRGSGGGGDTGGGGSKVLVVGVTGVTVWTGGVTSEPFPVLAGSTSGKPGSLSV